jgi:membrane-bound lytic murein transglycosylase D
MIVLYFFGALKTVPYEKLMVFRGYLKRVLLFVLFLGSVALQANIVQEKFPSYHYVFSEFGVEREFANDTYFQHFVLRYEKQLRGFYKHSLKRGEKLLPMIKGKLVKGGLSDLFLYLSMIESGFSPAAVSNKKAAGLWQFMPQTARHYKLSVHKEYDERYDPRRSTGAAVKYLSKLYKQFGKWYLAAMAYNCGEGRLERAIRKAGSHDISVLLDEKAKYLPKETRNYIRKILLVAMIGEAESMTYGDAPLLHIKVPVAPGTLLAFVAKLIEMPTQELEQINPNYRTNKDTTIVIPEDKVVPFYIRYDRSVHASQLEEQLAVTMVTTPSSNDKSYMITHNVRMGESLVSIAQKYHTTVEAIYRVNKRKDRESLLLGTMLIVPVSKEVFHAYSEELE